MNWTRTAVVATAAGALLLTGGATAFADDGVQVLINGDSDNRPGELVDIDVRGAKDEPVVSSPVFPRPVRLTVHDGEGVRGRVAVGMRVKPGWYPLTVKVGGRVVAKERIGVKAPVRPVFRVTAPDEVIRPGEQFGMSFDDLYPGETGNSFTVTSPVLPAPVRLKHDPEGSDWNNPRFFAALVTLPRTAKDGTYKVTLTGPGGRVIDEKPLRVGAAEPSDSDYLGRARGPAFYTPSGSPEQARARGHRVGAGGTVNVLWRDASPDPGEEEQLTATSPAFEHPVQLRRDDSKAADGDDPRFFGPARIRKDLGAGEYPVTVISHHGRVKKTEKLVVTAAVAKATVTPAAAGSAAGSGGPGGSDNTVLITAVGGGALAGAVLGGVLVRRRLRRGASAR